MRVVRHWFAVLLLAALANPCSAAEDLFGPAAPAHRDDGCRSSAYSGAERLAKHGYLGREAPMTQAIRNWMLGREFAREIQ